MAILVGVLIVLFAGSLQGSFYLPMTYTKKWEWEHTWSMFALFGMFIFSWIFIYFLVPGVFSVYQNVPQKDMLIMIAFGAIWGVGAVTNGLAIARLGMALAFPIVLGIVASFGALIPLILLSPEMLFKAKGITIILGTIVTIMGIITCSKAQALKTPQTESVSATQKGSFTVSLIIAIIAGVTSSLMNVGFAFSGNFIKAAVNQGVSETFAVNAVWGIILASGGTVNLLYCIYLMAKRNTFKTFFNPETPRNIALGAAMGLVWTTGLFLYGMGAAVMGKFGVVVGWILFMSAIIMIGNIWGIQKGEWKGAPPKARSLLNRGLAVLIIAIVIVAMSNNFN